jgi:flagellar basal-body rod protein FlgF
MDLIANIAASRSVAQQRALDVIAGNIANASTPGYRAERVQFADWLSRKPGARIAYAQDRATWREQQAGTLTHTANPLDLAISGDGYFTVSTSRGPRLTRDGRFAPLPDGRLADSAGNPLLDATGQPIQLAPSDTRISVAGDGTLSSENGQIGRIGVVAPQDALRTTPEGSTLLRADTPTAPVAAPAVVQGAIEDSNVQPVLEMTRMLDGLRQFQALAQFMQAEDDRQQQAIDKLLPNTP